MIVWFIIYNCDFRVLFCWIMIIGNSFRYFISHFPVISYFHDIEFVVTLTLFYHVPCLKILRWTRRRLQLPWSFSNDGNCGIWIGLSELIFYIPILKYFNPYTITRYKKILVHHFFFLHVAFHVDIKFAGMKFFFQVYSSDGNVNIINNKIKFF